MLKLSIVTDSETFRSLREPWHALWERLEHPHLFFSFDWCWNVWKLVAEPRRNALRLVTGTVDGRLVLIWPMMSDHRILRMLSSETLEYRDVIVERSVHEAQWVDEAWEYIVAHVRSDAFIFQNLRSPSVLARKMASLPTVRSIGGGWCPVIRLDAFADWDAYAATLPRSLVSDQRRQWKRLGVAMPQCTFKLIDRADAIGPVMDWLAHHKLRWGSTRGKPTIWFEAEDRRNLLKAIATLALANGTLVLGTLADGNTILSAGLGHVCGSEFLFHAFAYDESYGTYSPSRLLMQRLVQWCMDRGVRTYDFMPGDEAYKRIWSTDYIRTDSFMGALNWKGLAYMRLSESVATIAGPPAALERAYHMIPASLRDLVQRRLRGFRLVENAQGLALAPTEPPQRSADGLPSAAAARQDARAPHGAEDKSFSQSPNELKTAHERGVSSS